MDPEIRELVDFLAQTPALISRRIAALPDVEVRRQRADGSFSIAAEVCHLRDLEIEGYGARIERLLKEDRPSLPDFDGALIAIERDYNSQDVQEALKSFARARGQNLNRVSALPEEQFEREGTLDGVGCITLKRLLALMKEHDQGHLLTLIQP